jgi:hypothetical protein
VGREEDILNLRLDDLFVGRSEDRPSLVVAQGECGPFSPAALKRSQPGFGEILVAKGEALGLLMLRSSPASIRGIQRMPVPGSRLGDMRIGRPWPSIHVRALRAYAARLVGWLGRFRGVATRYLANYLAWHRAVDETAKRRAIEAQALRWPVPIAINSS